jgi:hypothetical protein
MNPHSSTAATAIKLDGTGLPVDFDYYIVPGTGGHGRARADALMPVIKTFGCRVTVFGYDATRNDKFLIMTGTRPALDALEILLPSVAILMEKAGRQAVKTYASQVHGAVPQMRLATSRRVLITPYFRDYLRGFGRGVAEQLHGMRTPAIRAGGQAMAEALADDQMRVDETFSSSFPDRKPLRPERGSHERAEEAGRRAGRIADIGDDYVARHDLVFMML